MNEAIEHNWPFVALVVQEASSFYRDWNENLEVSTQYFYCSGSLINRKTVHFLTNLFYLYIFHFTSYHILNSLLKVIISAHCLDYRAEVPIGKKIERYSQNFWVFFGYHNISFIKKLIKNKNETISLSLLGLRVEKAIIVTRNNSFLNVYMMFFIRILNFEKHKDYDIKTKLNDLALLKLKDLVNLNQFVQLVCLPRSNSSNQVDDWQNLTIKPTVVGWSISNTSSLSSDLISDVLEETTVSILNNSICNKFEDQHVPTNETANETNTTQTNNISLSHFIYSPPKESSNQSQLICAGKLFNLFNILLTYFMI